LIGGIFLDFFEPFNKKPYLFQNMPSVISLLIIYFLAIYLPYQY